MFRKSLFAVIFGVSFLVAGANESAAQTPGTQEYGLQVTQVLSGAGRVYGIETGDVIVRVNDCPVQSADELRYQLGRAGWKARLGVIDARSGWLNEIAACPHNGQIAVLVAPVRLSSMVRHNPPAPAPSMTITPRYIPVPFDPWGWPGLPNPWQPMPLPFPI